jgi:hypothetical protein
MIYWGIMLFALGMLALADYSVTRGEIFGPINSIIFLIISFAVLLRVRNKENEARWEKLQAENKELRDQLTQPETSTENKKATREAIAQ